MPADDGVGLDEDDVERVQAVGRLVAEGLTLSTAIARVASAGSGATAVGEGEEFLLRQVLQAADQGIDQPLDNRHISRARKVKT